MHRTLALFAALALVALPAAAELKKPQLIDCNAKKAARNAAMEATVGVHGGCDADKLADNARDDAQDKLKGAGDDAQDKVKDARDKRENKRDQKN